MIDIYKMDKYVTAYFIREIVKDGWFDKDLYILAFKLPGFADINVNDARTLLEQDIMRLDKDFKVSKVLERSPISVDGITGELVVSTYDLNSRRMPLPDGGLKGEPQKPNLIEISRNTYFDQGGLVWMISMTSTEEVAEETRADFAHLIKTFKILK
jgi:hypothetical protein